MIKSFFEVISVVGLGYIGLPTAAMFAARKIKVIGVDTNRHVVDTINRGEIHIDEPDLDIIVSQAVKENYLRATTEPEPADAFLIAVPTPFKVKGHEPDLGFIKAACKQIAPVLKRGDLVILESTSPIGTTERMAEWLAIERHDLSFPQTAGELSDICVAHCPERVLPGKIIQELITNDRVIGGISNHCGESALNLYKTFVTGECIIASSPRVAEMAKLTENSFRDVNIAFANELSMISDDAGIDVSELIQLANRHPRVNILQPGPGVGGHCIAVDPWFIINSFPEKSEIISSARTVNNFKPAWVISKINNFKSLFPDKKIIIFGISYKQDIGDLRESPSLHIAKHINSQYLSNVHIVEPNVSSFEGLSIIDLKSAIETYFDDIWIFLVNHKEFMCLKEISKSHLDFCGLTSLNNNLSEEKI